MDVFILILLIIAWLYLEVRSTNRHGDDEEKDGGEAERDD